MSMQNSPRLLFIAMLLSSAVQAGPFYPNVVEITQNTSPIPEAGVSVACTETPPGWTNDNHYFRRFIFSDHDIISEFNVVKLDWWVEQVTHGSGYPVDIRLYAIANTAPLTFANMGAPIASVEWLVDDTEEIWREEVLINATISDPTSTDLVVEIFTPWTGGTLFVGASDQGQSRPSFIAAPDCDVDEPTDLATLGSPDVAWIMKIYGVAKRILDERFYILNQFTLPPNLTTPLGDLAFSPDGNTAYVVNQANSTLASIWSADVLRGPDNEVTGFGTFTEVFSYDRANTGLLFGPGTDTFLFRRRPSPGSIIQRFPSGATEFTAIENYEGRYGGIAFIPDGYTYSGDLLAVSYAEGKIYLHPTSADGDGSFTIVGASPLVAADLSSSIGFDVIGDIEYIDQGPLRGHVIVSGLGILTDLYTMPVDEITGFPDDTVVTPFASNSEGDTWGLAVDPVTGNIWYVGFTSGELTQIAVNSVVFKNGFEE